MNNTESPVDIAIGTAYSVVFFALILIPIALCIKYRRVISQWCGDSENQPINNEEQPRYTFLQEQDASTVFVPMANLQRNNVTNTTQDFGVSVESRLANAKELLGMR